MDFEPEIPVWQHALIVMLVAALIIIGVHFGVIP